MYVAKLYVGVRVAKCILVRDQRIDIKENEVSLTRYMYTEDCNRACFINECMYVYVCVLQ